LYFFDTLACDTHKDTTCLVQSVEDNKSSFVKREIDAADAARDLYRKLGRPSQAKFEEIIAKNIVRTCPVTIDDARRVLTIYGPDMASIKGKTSRGKPALHVRDHQPISLPMSIVQFHLDVTLCMNFFTYRVRLSYTSYQERFNIG
jgi:hypothetical protein